MFRRVLSRFLSHKSQFNGAYSFYIPVLQSMLIGSTIFVTCESNSQKKPIETPLIFHTASLPSNFNYSRFVKFIVRDEDQLKLIQEYHSKTIDNELDYFDFCFGLWKDEFGTGSFRSKQAAGLLIPNGEQSETENDEKYKVGVHIQVDYRSEIAWFDIRNSEDLVAMLASAKVLSAPIPESTSQPNVVIPLVFDNFLPTILNIERNPLVVLFTTDDCPVCSKAKLLFELSKRMTPLANVDIALYSLSSNAIPPGMFESSIPGTPHYIYFPKLMKEQAEKAKSLISSSFADLAARYDGVSRSEESLKAEKGIQGRIDDALKSGSGAVGDKTVISKDFVNCSDFLMALNAVDIDPLEAVKFPSLLSANINNNTIEDINSLCSIVASFASLFLMAQCSEFQSNRDDTIKKIGSTLQFHGFTESDEDMQRISQALCVELDKNMSAKIHSAELNIENNPAELLEILKATRAQLMKQYSIMSVLIDRGRDEINVSNTSKISSIHDTFENHENI